MGLYINGNKVLEGSWIISTDGTSLKPLADDTYYLGSAAYRWAGGYFGANGVDVNPDSDADADLITMSVTGTPKFWWDESDNRFTLTHGLDIDAGRLIVNGAAATDQNSITSNPLRTLVDNNEVINISSSPEFAKISAAYNNIAIAVLGRVILDNTNTQNWTADPTGNTPGMIGVEGSVRVETGSAGLVTRAACIFQKGDGEIADGASITHLIGYMGQTLTGAGLTAGNVANVYMMYLQDVGALGTVSNYAIYSAGGASYHVGSWNNVGNLIAGGLDAQVTTPADGTIRGSNVATGGAGNVAGADLYIKGGLGTGTGDVGQIIFQTAQVAGAGDFAQTLETILTLDEDEAVFAKSVRFGAFKHFINETADTDTTIALIINQGAADDSIFSLKSSDVAHGFTSLLETDTFAKFQKSEGAAGGLAIWTATDADATIARTMLLLGVSGIALDTTKSTAGRGVIEVHAGIGSGTTWGAITADGNLFAIRSVTTGGALSTALILDEDGDLWLNGALTLGTAGSLTINSLQVVGARQVDARIDDTPNSGDVTTDGIIAALQACVQTHGLMTAA